MSQKQKPNRRQSESLLQEHKRGQSRVTDQYERQFQDASYEERQAEVQLDLAELDELDDFVEESPDNQDDSDFNSEVSTEDEDAIREEHQEFQSVHASEERMEEGGFETDVDAIFILPLSNGAFRCIVEEDLSRWANLRSQSPKDGKATSSEEIIGEPRRTMCYRAIAKWLEEDFQTVLCSPDLLLKQLKSAPWTQTTFCEKKDLGKSYLSRALKDAKIIWPDYAIPMELLFDQSQN